VCRRRGRQAAQCARDPGRLPRRRGAFWKRFNADSGTLHWYYGGVANALEPRLEGRRAHAMVEELQDMVNSVWGAQKPTERSLP
jgi:hypothetical protein